MEMNRDLEVGIKGDYLKDKNISLVVTGGIAAIETPKLARALRRYGAEVNAYMTPNAEKFVGKEALMWGTGKDVITNLSGNAEHINKYDLILITPATLNFIGEISSGMAMSSASTLVASALGSKTPVLVAPTMHESMYNNPFFNNNLNDLKENGIKIIKPRFSEGKAKIPKLENIVAEVSRELSTHSIKGKRILITGGPTPVKIDDVRRITNRFRGSLARKIAIEAYHRGADIKLLLGSGSILVPSYIDVSYHDDYDEYFNNVFSELDKQNYDGAVFSAAVADYRPKEKYEGKIPSGGAIKIIELIETKKVIDCVRTKHQELFMTTFKLELGLEKEKLLEIAYQRSKKYNLVIANTWQNSGDSHKAYIVEKEKVISYPQNAEDIAFELINIMGERLK